MLQRISLKNIRLTTEKNNIEVKAVKIYEIVFSPTGGTQKAADIIAKGLGAEIEVIDLSDKNFSGCSLENGNAAVISMPSFGGRAPKTAVDRLKMIKASGVKAVAVAVYGNRAQEDTLIEIADAAEECGFDVIAGISAIAEHSIAHQYASGRPDAKDNEELTNFAKRITEKMIGSDESKPNIPGKRPYKNAGAGLVPKASSDCVKCGICAAKCPVGAIHKSDPKKTDKNVCINCMRCVSVCPHNARAVSGMMAKMVEAALKKACSDRKRNELYL